MSAPHPDPAQPRPTLAERRKSETRLDIARTAARLFAEHGTAEVTAEEIAAAAGIGLRTFYRYTRTKEEAVEPMLAAGAERWLAGLAAGPHRLPTLDDLEQAAVEALTPDGGIDDLEITRGLLRAMDSDSALRVVWYRINLEGERQLLRVLTELAGPQANSLQLRLTAADAAGAIRVALEQWAADDGPVIGAGSPADLVVRCLRAPRAGG